MLIVNQSLAANLQTEDLVVLEALFSVFLPEGGRYYMIDQNIAQCV